MIRNLKALSLALVAIFAMGALVAGSASAAGERFHSETELTILTGVDEPGTNHVFKSGSLEITCENATFAGTAKGVKVAEKDYVTTEQTVHPTYTGCSDNVFGGTDTVDTTGCNYVFKSETNATKHLPAEIECTANFSIKVTAPGCTLSFGAQKNGGGVSVKNEGSGTTRDVTNASTTTATFTKSGFACGLVAGTTGEYIGPTTTKGYVDNGVTGNIDEVNGAGADETTIYHEGAQVGIWWQ